MDTHSHSLSQTTFPSLVRDNNHQSSSRISSSLILSQPAGKTILPPRAGSRRCEMRLSMRPTLHLSKAHPSKMFRLRWDNGNFSWMVEYTNALTPARSTLGELTCPSIIIIKLKNPLYPPTATVFFLLLLLFVVVFRPLCPSPILIKADRLFVLLFWTHNFLFSPPLFCCYQPSCMLIWVFFLFHKLSNFTPPPSAAPRLRWNAHILECQDNRYHPLYACYWPS